jgi:DNA-binding transcriptional ArsR family regulator
VGKALRTVLTNAREMSSLLPSESDGDVEDAEGDVRVLTIDDEDTEQLIASLSSETARSLLSALHESPATASDLSEEVETSLQNVRHHLDNLREAGVIEVADTRYSVKGREMKVYAPARDSLVVCVGSEEARERFLDSLSRPAGAVALLAGAALVVGRLFGGGAVALGGPETAPRVGDSVGGAATTALGLLSPAVAFLAGGLLVLAMVATWQRLS